jgi:hypothetical protein
LNGAAFRGLIRPCSSTSFVRPRCKMISVSMSIWWAGGIKAWTPCRQELLLADMTGRRSEFVRDAADVAHVAHSGN